MRLSRARSAWCAMCMLALAPVMAQSVGAPHWEYSGEQGPANWGKLRRDYAICDLGQRQSPIDIVETHKQKLPEIQFQYRSAPLRLVNDGHTVRVRMANGSRIVLGKDSYALQQFHFHVPGGDRIQGREYGMAAHFVHKSSAGRLAVVVVLFRQGGENAALASLWPKIPARADGERLFPEFTLDATQLLPAARGYYAYEGSLTAPPCTEGVYWMVLKQPLELSAEQLARYSKMFPNNSRPVQPLHGRVVKESL
jgi:carbonic anhydrase